MTQRNYHEHEHEYEHERRLTPLKTNRFAMFKLVNIEIYDYDSFVDHDIYGIPNCLEDPDLYHKLRLYYVYVIYKFKEIHFNIIDDDIKRYLFNDTRGYFLEGDDMLECEM